MASEVKVDKLSQKGSSGIVISDDIKLSVDKAIKNAAGTALLTQAGVLDNVSLGSSVTGLPAGGITDFSQWRLTGSFTGHADPIASNLAEVSATNYERIGDAFDAPSSGVFTFPSTGKWLITFNVLFDAASQSRYNHTYLKTTVDNGSNWVTGARGSAGWGSTSVDVYSSCTCSFLFDVTVLATHKCSFQVLVAGVSAVTTEGSASESLTYINFMKLGGT